VSKGHEDKAGAPVGNQNARVVHGGAGAVRRIQGGRPFVGLAAQEEAQVIEDLETSGRGELVREAAVRLHTAMRLYWGAVQTAADAGDLERLDSYCARFGWLASSALRAWREVREEEKARGDGGALDYEAILSAKAAQENGADG
jgi:hypothetical protein